MISGLIEVLMVVVAAGVGAYLLSGPCAAILNGEKIAITKPLRWLETLSHLAIGTRHVQTNMDLRRYANAIIVFHLLGVVFLFAILCLQNLLPLNPQNLPGLPWDLALNTAISFVTNTNWQAYSGEASMSYFSQSVGLTVQNFLSAATGIAVMTALARGLVQSSGTGLGNFWQDLTRATVYILLPLSIVLALALISQGVIQNYHSYVEIKTIEGLKQVLPMGPAASQIAIKQLGSNGGGFFGVNSAHPFENPTPLSNFLQLVAILILPATLPLTFGRLVKQKSHGNTLFITMALMMITSLVVALIAESSKNPALGSMIFMEGKEVRFGIASSTLWTTLTTLTSNGSVNSMISSASPLVGFCALFNIMLGEVVFGGVGCGVYGMILFVIVAVFIAGLMVGRTPEYLGKKIEAREITLAAIGVLAPCVIILIFSAVAVLVPSALASLGHAGPHGLTEILYAFSSAAGNNGSAFAGLNANTVFYNLTLSLDMLVGRFGVLIPALAIGASMSVKKIAPPSSGTMPTSGLMFGILLVGTILVVGALTFFPALVLGPVAEHLFMNRGVTF